MGSNASKNHEKSLGLESDSYDLGRTEIQKNSFLGGKYQKNSEAKSSLQNTETDPTGSETARSRCTAGGDYKSEIDGTKSDIVLSNTQETVAAESESKKSVVVDSMSEIEDDDTVLDSQISIVLSGTQTIAASESESNDFDKAESLSESDDPILDSHSDIVLSDTQAIVATEIESNILAKADSMSETDTILNSQSGIVLSGTPANLLIESESNNLALAEESDKPLMWLPYELLQKIWKDLTFTDLKNMRCVSNWWRIHLNVAEIFVFKPNVGTSSELQTLLAASCPIEFVKIEARKNATKITSTPSDTENFPMIQEVIIGSRISPDAFRNIFECLEWNLKSLTFDENALEGSQTKLLTSIWGRLEWRKLCALTLVICLEKQDAATQSENMLCLLNFAKVPALQKFGFKLNYSFGSLISLRDPVQKLCSGFYSFVQSHAERLCDLSFKLISEDRNKLPIPRFPDSFKNALNGNQNLQTFEIVTKTNSVYEDALDLLMNLGFPLRKIKVVLRQSRESLKYARVDKTKLENIIRMHGNSLEELAFDLQEGLRQTGLDLKILQRACPRLKTLSLKIYCTSNAEQLQIPTLKNVSVQVHESSAFELVQVNGAGIQRLTLWETSRAFNSRAIYTFFPALTYLHIQNLTIEVYINFVYSRLPDLKEFKTTFPKGFSHAHARLRHIPVANTFTGLFYGKPALETLTVFGIVVESKSLKALTAMGQFKRICFEACGKNLKEYCRVTPTLTLKVTPKSKTQIENSIFRDIRDIYEVRFNKLPIQN